MDSKRAQPGEPLRIPAATWNVILDTVQRDRGDLADDEANVEMSDSTADGPWPSSAIIRVRNDTGAIVSRFGVVALSDAPITPSSNLDQFQRYPSFAGTTPTATTTSWAVLLEPLDAGQWGEALVQGMVACQVEVLDAGHTRARAKSGSVTQLQSAATGGEGVLVWKESGTGSKWAYVLLMGGPLQGITAAAADGTPSYAGVTELRFDETDGFVLSQPSAGVVRVDFAGAGGVTVEETGGLPSIAADKIVFNGGDGFNVVDLGSGDARIDLPGATPTQNGTVLTSDQEWAGAKHIYTPSGADQGLSTSVNASPGQGYFYLGVPPSLGGSTYSLRKLTSSSPTVTDMLQLTSGTNNGQVTTKIDTTSSYVESRWTYGSAGGDNYAVIIAGSPGYNFSCSSSTLGLSAGIGVTTFPSSMAIMSLSSGGQKVVEMRATQSATDPLEVWLLEASLQGQTVTISYQKPVGGTGSLTFTDGWLTSYT